MAIEPMYCRGARGDVILALQEALKKQKVPSETGGGLEPALDTADGEFGVRMQRAVQRVQQAHQLLMTGAVDGPTWKLLMGATPWPGAFERLLYVMAGFEGHFYSRATGDRPPNDAVGMTWGLIGFTLVQPDDGGGFNKGPLCALLAAIHSQHRDLMVDAFGKDKADQLAAALQLAPTPLHQFAVDNLSTESGAGLRAPWAAGFSRLGEDEKIRALQREHASRYYDKARDLANDFIQKFDMDCERTLLYFLDFAINNGDFKDKEKPKSVAAIAKLVADNPRATIAQKLQCITEVLAQARPRYAPDIRERKGTLAHGFGYVHGHFYRLEGWAIDVAEPGPTQPQPLRLSVLGLDGQRREQLAFAREARNLKLAEEAAAEPLQNGRFPLKTGHELLVDGTTRSVGMPALGSQGAAILNRNFTEHYEAAQMLFRGRTGVLVISGQITLPLATAPQADRYILQRSGRTYAGLVLKANDQLLLTRQRAAGATAGESVVDITELRRSLGGCVLLVLYGGYGVPTKLLPGSGLRWREWLQAAGAKPLVLGWFGNARPPQDSEKATLADRFLANVSALKPGADLVEICRDLPGQVVEQWGVACHAVFAKSRQRYLWLDDPVPGIERMKSGAAAIDPGGTAWWANGTYSGAPGQSAMTKA